MTFVNNDKQSSHRDAETGLDPEELPLFKEFEAFVAAVYEQATEATSRQLNNEVSRLSQTVEATTVKLNREISVFAQTVKSSQNDYLLLFKPFTEDFNRQHQHLFKQHSIKVDDKIDKLKSEVIERTNALEDETKCMISDLQRQQNLQYITISRMIWFLFGICGVTLVMIPILILLLRH